MSFKLLFLILPLLAGMAVSAQSPFKPLLKVKAPTTRFVRSAVPVVVKDSLQNTWRFIADIAAYAEPGNILMAGIGYGYQHLKYDYAAQKWNCLWSVNGVGFAGGSVAPSTPASIASFGIMAGIDNNLFMAGPIYNPGTKKFGLAVSVGISLNN